MVDKLCDYLTNRIKKEMPEINKEKLEIINYGIHLIVGEIPKTFLFMIIAIILGIFKEFLIACLVIFPYRAFSGGFHLKTHIGCILMSSIYYCGIAYISKMFTLSIQTRIVCSIAIWIFGIAMCIKYAPADTENVPILRKKDRKIKKIVSCIVLTITICVGVLINNNIVSNIIMLGMLIQSLMITRFAYKITKNKYGYEVYLQELNV